MANRGNTAVIILKDFQIRALPLVPNSFTQRIDANVWKEFTDQVQNNLHNTFSQKHDCASASALRCKLYFCYWICAPVTCVTAYLAYYCLTLAPTLGVFLLVVGALLAIIAVGTLIGAIWSSQRCKSLMREYRTLCEQDLNQIFNYMNTRYNNAIYLSPARSTHKNNGEVQLGITIVLNQQQIMPSMGGQIQTVNYAQPLRQQQQQVMIQLPDGRLVPAQIAQNQPQIVVVQQPPPNQMVQHIQQTQPVAQTNYDPPQYPQQQQQPPPQYNPNVDGGEGGNFNNVQPGGGQETNY